MSQLANSGYRWSDFEVYSSSIKRLGWALGLRKLFEERVIWNNFKLISIIYYNYNNLFCLFTTCNHNNLLPKGTCNLIKEKEKNAYKGKGWIIINDVF